MVSLCLSLSLPLFCDTEFYIAMIKNINYLFCNLPTGGFFISPCWSWGLCIEYKHLVILSPGFCWDSLCQVSPLQQQMCYFMISSLSSLGLWYILLFLNPTGKFSLGNGIIYEGTCTNVTLPFPKQSFAYFRLSQQLISCPDACYLIQYKSRSLPLEAVRTKI